MRAAGARLARQQQLQTLTAMHSTHPQELARQIRAELQAGDEPGPSDSFQALLATAR